MSFKVFIDGKAGTAGLELSQLLAERDDITILEIDEENRKNLEAKLELMKSADLTFLCLPDAAAVEMADAAPAQCRIIDTSTAHRTKDGWTYGMPEIGYRDEIRTSNRVANPGCHATGFIMAARPLVECGIVGKDHPFAATSLTGFSGGGKQMIAEYGEEEIEKLEDAMDQLELMEVVDPHMSEEDLEELKRKHRLAEQKAIMKADMDYLKGVIKLQMQKGAEAAQGAGSGNGSGGLGNGAGGRSVIPGIGGSTGGITGANFSQAPVPAVSSVFTAMTGASPAGDVGGGVELVDERG